MIDAIEEKTMTTTRQMNQAELDQLIADEFGVNADYVSELLQQFKRNPASVDGEWRSYFDELFTDGQPANQTSRRQRPAQAPQASRTLQPTYDWGAQPAAPAVEPPQLHPCASSPCASSISATASRAASATGSA